jgi:translation initiation factor 2-alpha kinase 4
MYSLGIIFFEMCYPLKTAMERDHVIRKLREKDFVLPPDFESEKRAVQGDIITSLLKHRPNERPSSAELLQCGKLPVQIEDETIQQALRGLSDPNSPYYQKMMSAVFSQPTKQAKDYAWDIGTTAYGSYDLLLQSYVRDVLTSIFRHHGAVETSRPLLFPRSRYYSNNVVQLLDSSGTLVQLPYDLTLPHARAIARQAPPSQKSFAFGKVYRDLHAGGQPRSHGEVDFDIISYDSLDLTLKEAEVMKVIDEIVDAFPSIKTAQMCFHINHSDLLEVVMEYCRISVPQRPAVKEILSKLNIGQWTWLKIRNELRALSLGVSSTSVDDLAQFDFRGIVGNKLWRS